MHPPKNTVILLNKEHSLVCFLLCNFQYIMTKIKPENTATLEICFSKRANVCEIVIQGRLVFFIFLYLQFMYQNFFFFCSQDYFILFQVTKFQFFFFCIRMILFYSKSLNFKFLMVLKKSRYSLWWWDCLELVDLHTIFPNPLVFMNT